MTSKIHIYQLAHMWGVSTLDVMKRAIEYGIGYTPSKEEAELLRRATSGFYELPDKDKRSIDDFLKSEEASPVLEEARKVRSMVTEDQWKEYIGIAAKRLYDLLPDSPLKQSMRPEAIAEAMRVSETIMNLGVVRIRRSSAQEPTATPDIRVVAFNPGTAYNVAWRHFIEVLETMPARTEADFDAARERVAAEAARLREYANRKP